jgi:Double zinc ribbon
MKCANCGAENPKRLKFCEQCAAPFKKRCAHCGFENSPAARFCGECAALLDSTLLTSSAQQSHAVPIRLAEPLAPQNLEGERKIVTALFADL